MRTKLGSKFSLLFVAFAVMLAIPAVVLADNIVDDLDGSAASKTITTGESFTNNYWIVANAGGGGSTDPQAGCNASDSSPAHVTINAPADVTVTYPNDGTDLTFTKCKEGSNNNSQAVTFTSNKAGTYNITASVSDTGTGGYNTNPASFTLTVNAPSGGGGGGTTDTTAPTIDYVLNPASPDGQNGWYKSNVSLTWNVVENESTASLVKTGCEDQNITSDQQETTYSCSATSDGGSAGPVEVKIKRDATKPTNVQFSGGPADGASYDFGDVPAAPTGCTADDATSGFASCNVTGYSTAVGNQTLTATAADNAGNKETKTLSYTVVAWTLKGFYPPVDMGIHNTMKAGQTVPLKFEIFKTVSGTELTDTSVIKTFTQKINCTTTGGVDAIEEFATGNTALRYDTTSGQFIFNWKSLKTPGTCYRDTMTTQDGSSISADFTLK